MFIYPCIQVKQVIPTSETRRKLVIYIHHHRLRLRFFKSIRDSSVTSLLRNDYILKTNAIDKTTTEAQLN